MRTLVLTMLCLAPASLFAARDGAYTDYACYFLDSSGAATNNGYGLRLWFDTTVDARFIPKRSVSTIDCQLEIFGVKPDDLAFNCKVNGQLMTLTMSKTTLNAQAAFMDAKTYNMSCRKR